MKTIQLILIIFCLALSLDARALDTDSDSTSETTQEQPITSSAPISVDRARFFIPCEFDSFKTTCLLDTGSTFSTVNSNEFDHYPAWGHIKYNSGTGKEVDVDKIYIHKITLAQHFLKSWPVARLSHLTGSENIVGLDAFRRTPVLFDFKKHLLTFNPPEPDNLPSSPIVLEYGLLLLPVKIGDQSLYAVWDTGASSCVVDKDYILKHPNDFTFVKKVEGSDATQNNMPMNLYLIKKIVIGGISFTNVHVAAADLSGMRRVHPNFPVFFLGYNLMAGHSWYFDLANFQWGVE